MQAGWSHPAILLSGNSQCGALENYSRFSSVTVLLFLILNALWHAKFIGDDKQKFVANFWTGTEKNLKMQVYKFCHCNCKLHSWSHQMPPLLVPGSQFPSLLPRSPMTLPGSTPLWSDVIISQSWLNFSSSAYTSIVVSISKQPC